MPHKNCWKIQTSIPNRPKYFRSTHEILIPISTRTYMPGITVGTTETKVPIIEIQITTLGINRLFDLEVECPNHSDHNLIPHSLINHHSDGITVTIIIAFSVEDLISNRVEDQISNRGTFIQRALSKSNQCRCQCHLTLHGQC